VDFFRSLLSQSSPASDRVFFPGNNTGAAGFDGGPARTACERDDK
jgi:hypothetical protein